jgi:hypothetical protein
MDYLYIDEKGPQETIRMTTPYDEEKKIKLGNDNMYVYVADLKGKDILGKNFKFGIPSLKGRELDFYNSLFDLLLENHVNSFWKGIKEFKSSLGCFTFQKPYLCLKRVYPPSD